MLQQFMVLKIKFLNQKLKIIKKLNKNVNPNMAAIFAAFILSSVISAAFIQALPNVLGLYQIKPTINGISDAIKIATKFTLM